jgi:hypothetical protein
MRKAAEARVRDRPFREDLMMLATDAVPSWDGIADIEAPKRLWARRRNGGASRARAIRNGDIEHEDGT